MDHDFELSVGISFKDLGNDARKHEHDPKFKESLIKVCEDVLEPLCSGLFVPETDPPFMTSEDFVPADTVRKWLDCELAARKKNEVIVEVDNLEYANCRYTKLGWVAETAFTMELDNKNWRCHEVVEHYECETGIKLERRTKNALTDMRILVIVRWKMNVASPTCAKE